MASVLGLIFAQYFFAYHLLHIAEFNQLVNRAIKAVTKNGTVVYLLTTSMLLLLKISHDVTVFSGRALIWIFFFGLMFVFIFAQINFAFYRELFSEPESTGLYCETMYQCFVTVFHRGLILSLFEVK